jgi:hypothetical protein
MLEKKAAAVSGWWAVAASAAWLPATFEANAVRTAAGRSRRSIASARAPPACTRPATSGPVEDGHALVTACLDCMPRWVRELPH